MKPIIGITCGMREDKFAFLNYKNIDVIKKAGGVPIVLPLVKEECDSYLEIVDGILFSGGKDLNPMFLDEDPIPGIGATNIRRDEFELELYKKAIEKNISILGICRGLQVINIAAGGSIYQDLKNQFDGCLCHRQEGTPSYNYFHKLDIVEDSELFKIYNDNAIYTNSFHHQAVKDVAPGFKIVAKARDGVIEAIESTDNKFVLAVQWHPELMYVEHEEHFKIFKRFIEKCKKV